MKEKASVYFDGQLIGETSFEIDTDFDKKADEWFDKKNANVEHGLKELETSLTTGGIMDYGEICQCDTNFLCEHRIKWIIEFVRNRISKANAKWIKIIDFDVEKHGTYFAARMSSNRPDETIDVFYVKDANSSKWWTTHPDSELRTCGVPEEILISF